MSQLRDSSVYGHTLPPPRPTPWVPFLLACALSLPVLIVSVVSLILS